MPIRNDIVDVLTRAEDQLANRMERAVKAREYADVAALASVSQKVHDLIQSMDAELAVSASTRTAPRAVASHSKARKPGGFRSGNGAGRRARRKYPMFARDGNQLVKTGWSKKTRAEYRHRVPEPAVSAIVSALRRFGSAEFSMGGLTPVQNEDGTTLPSYQVYLVVAWLRACGAVKKAGRGGYLPVPDRLDVAAVSEHWSALELVAAQRGSEGGPIDD